MIISPGPSTKHPGEYGVGHAARTRRSSWPSATAPDVADRGRRGRDARKNVKMAEAVTMAKIAGNDPVDWALGDAALNGRFGAPGPRLHPQRHIRRTTTRRPTSPGRWPKAPAAGPGSARRPNPRSHRGAGGGRVSAAPALPAEVEQLMRQLKMPYARALAPELIATAKAQRWEPVEVIKALFAEEVAGRGRSMLATRRKAAGFPTGKTFDAWDPAASSIPAPTQQALRTLEWVHRRENLVVCGPSGTGKTFFLEALGQARRRNRHAGRLVHPRGPRRPHPRPPHRRHRHPSRRPDPPRRSRGRSTTSGCCRSPTTPPKASTGSSTPPTRNAPSRYQLEPAPSRVRRAHAQNPGHRHRRPAAPPRPRLPNQRRLDPPHPSPHRERSHPPELTTPRWPTPPNHSGQICWPSPGTSDGHQRADLLTAHGQNLLAIDRRAGLRHERGYAMQLRQHHSSLRSESQGLARGQPRTSCRTEWIRRIS